MTDKAETPKTPRDIEWLVGWALIDNGLGGQFSDDFSKVTWSDLGTRVSGGSWGGGAPRLQHEDAARLAEMICQLPLDAAALVVQHGRVGDRPDWCEEGEGRLEQKRNKRGQLEWDFERPGDYRSARRARMVWVGERPEQVRWYRARYGLWHAGLGQLRVWANAAMTGFEATGPAAPATPWVGAPPVVWGPDGEAIAGLGEVNAAARLARLDRRGPLDMGPEPVAANRHAAGSSGRG